MSKSEYDLGVYDAWMAVEGLIAAGATLEEIAGRARDETRAPARRTPSGAPATS